MPARASSSACRVERLRVGARELELVAARAAPGARACRRASARRRRSNSTRSCAACWSSSTEPDSPSKHEIEAERLAEVAQAREHDPAPAGRAAPRRRAARPRAALGEAKKPSASAKSPASARRAGARTVRARLASAARRPRAPPRRSRAAAGRSPPRIAEAHLPLRRVDVHVDLLEAAIAGTARRPGSGRAAARRGRRRAPRTAAGGRAPGRPFTYTCSSDGPLRSTWVGLAKPRTREPAERPVDRHEQASPAPGDSTAITRSRGSRSAGTEQRAAAVALELEAHVGAGQRDPLQPAHHVTRLGRRALQELAPRRHAAEQLGHLDPRALGARDRGDPVDARALALQLGAERVAAAPGAHAHAGDRRDARQRLAAKAEARDPLQVFGASRACWLRDVRRPAARRRGPCRCRRPRPRSRRSRRPGSRRGSVSRRASRAFSTSSFTTEAGRSTTSPAAIWLTSSSGRTRIGIFPLASPGSEGITRSGTCPQAPRRRSENSLTASRPWSTSALRGGLRCQATVSVAGVNESAGGTSPMPAGSSSARRRERSPGRIQSRRAARARADRGGRPRPLPRLQYRVRKASRRSSSRD